MNRLDEQISSTPRRRRRPASPSGMATSAAKVVTVSPAPYSPFHIYYPSRRGLGSIDPQQTIFRILQLTMVTPSPVAGEQWHAASGRPHRPHRPDQSRRGITGCRFDHMWAPTAPNSPGGSRRTARRRSTAEVSAIGPSATDAAGTLRHRGPSPNLMMPSLVRLGHVSRDRR